MKYHKDMSLPSKNEVFVFGSNLAGIHGKGAAKLALQYGARYGVGVGPSGRTYAIPTKGYDIETLSLEHIIPYIKRFTKITYEYPTVKFFITRIGCGLAGYKDKDIAPHFKGCNDNCSFPIQWKEFLEERKENEPSSTYSK